MAEKGVYVTHIDWVAPGSSATGQIPMGAASESLSGTAAQHRVTDRATPGDLTDFYANVTINAMANASTLAVRLNGTVGNLSISIAGSTTGLMSDLSGTDSVVDTDTFNHTLATGLSASDIRVICGVAYTTTGQFAFQPAAGAAAGSTISTASTSFYASPMGRLVHNSTESVSRLSAIGSTTISKMQMYVSANARTNSTTVVSRNNAADGNQTFSIASAATGLFEDTTNTDTVSDGNYYTTKTTLGTVTNNLTIRYISFKVATSSANWCPLYGNNGFTVSAAANTQRSFANAQRTGGAPIPYSGGASNLYISISANTVTAASSCTLRIGGTNSALSASITASTTGRFIDTTNTVALVAGDLIDVDVTAGSTGTSLTVREFGVNISSSVAVSVSVTGNSVTASVGDETVTGTAVASPTGEAATASVGDETVITTAVISPTGEAATASVGDETVVTTAVVSPTGEAATASVGSVTVVQGSGVSTSVTGQSITASVGTVTTTQGAGVSVTGNAATASVGDETVENDMVFTVTGLAGAAAVGTAIAGTVTNISVEVTGIRMLIGTSYKDNWTDHVDTPVSWIERPTPEALWTSDP